MIIFVLPPTPPLSLQVKICGHGTLAAAHFLFTSGFATTGTIEFVTKSGLLTAKRVNKSKQSGILASPNSNAEGNIWIELDFPTISLIDCNPAEVPFIPRTLNGTIMKNVKKAEILNDLIVELSSGKAVAELQPQFDELRECAGRGVIVTGLAPTGSGFDFFTRFFCPKLGVNEFKQLDQPTGGVTAPVGPIVRTLQSRASTDQSSSKAAGSKATLAREGARRQGRRGSPIGMREKGLVDWDLGG
ncbi:hypothetical protein ACLOJK_018600 [Asimina triloba]